MNVMQNQTHFETTYGAQRERTRYVEQLGAVHALRDELELSGEAYRDLLERLTGSRSAKSMTYEQRDRVIAFMTLYRELDAAVSHAEEARATLNASYSTTPSHLPMLKRLSLNGDPIGEVTMSLEDAILMMRERYDERVHLVGASEARYGSVTTLSLEFASL